MAILYIKMLKAGLLVSNKNVTYYVDNLFLPFSYFTMLSYFTKPPYLLASSQMEVPTIYVVQKNPLEKSDQKEITK